MLRPSAQDAVLDIVGLIHDAVLEPKQWQRVLNRVVRQFDGVAGVIVVNGSDRGEGTAIASRGFDPSFMRHYFDYYVHRDPVLDAKSRLPLGRAVTSATLMPPDSFVRTEFYNDWFKPQGFGGGISAVLHRQDGRATWLTIVGSRCEDETSAKGLGAFALLLPHMVRAMRVAERLDSMGDLQHAFRSTIAAVTHAVMLVDRRGRLVFANPPAEHLLEAEQPLIVRQGRVSARNPAIDAALQAALARAAAHEHDDRRGIGELVVPRVGQRSLVVSVAPTSRRYLDNPGSDRCVAAMIVAADPDRRPWNSLGGFIRAYGLTPAEGKVLDALVDGDGLEAAALRLGIGYATAKTHLTRILAKTGTTRQNQLIRLVAGTLPPLRG